MSASKTIREETYVLKERVLALMPDDLITGSIDLYVAYLHWLLPTWIFFDTQVESSPLPLAMSLSDEAGLRINRLSADYSFLTHANDAVGKQEAPSLYQAFQCFAEIPTAEQAVGMLTALLSLERDSRKIEKQLKKNAVRSKEAVTFYSGNLRRRRREREHFFRTVDEVFSKSQTQSAVEAAGKTLRSIASHFDSYEDFATSLRTTSLRPGAK